MYGPTLEETIIFIKKPDLVMDKSQLSQHLENLLYIKSVLHVDDKNNPKHLHRIQVVLAALQKKFSEELSKAVSAEGNLILPTQLITANKIIDTGIARLKEIIAHGEISETAQTINQVAQEKKPVLTQKEEWNSPASKKNPKLRETFGFLVSIIDDPLRNTPKMAEHFSNLEKISKLIKKKYQDPKIQKVNENILGILGKIYGTNNNKEINQALDNSIQILKNRPQYQVLLNDFETNLKNYLVQAEGRTENSSLTRQVRVEKFYANFKDEKNMMKKITMIKTVLTSPAYKYDKELNAASMALLKGLEGMGLQIDL